jgi:hypothetical protein
MDPSMRVRQAMRVGGAATRKLILTLALALALALTPTKTMALTLPVTPTLP